MIDRLRFPTIKEVALATTLVMGTSAVAACGDTPAVAKTKCAVNVESGDSQWKIAEDSLDAASLPDELSQDPKYRQELEAATAQEIMARKDANALENDLTPTDLLSAGRKYIVIGDAACSTLVAKRGAKNVSFAE